MFAHLLLQNRVRNIHCVTLAGTAAHIHTAAVTIAGFFVGLRMAFVVVVVVPFPRWQGQNAVS
jgi:hypothetical protein